YHFSGFRYKANKKMRGKGLGRGKLIATRPDYGTRFGQLTGKTNFKSMRINFLRKKLPIICPICLILTLLFSCSDTNRSGNYSTLNAEVDTVGGFDNTFVNPGLTGTTTRMSKNPKVTTNPEPASMPVNPVTDAAGYYNYTETAPAFAGGTDALQLYFDNNLTYPQDAIDNNVEGTVMVKFT